MLPSLKAECLAFDTDTDMTGVSVCSMLRSGPRTEGGVGENTNQSGLRGIRDRIGTVQREHISYPNSNAITERLKSSATTN